MEGQVTRHGEHPRHRVRVRRKLTLWEKVKKALEMPQLKRRDRNQRVAIVGVILLLGVYFLILRPIADLLYPDTATKAGSSAPGLRQKK